MPHLIVGYTGETWFESLVYIVRQFYAGAGGFTLSNKTRGL